MFIVWLLYVWFLCVLYVPVPSVLWYCWLGLLTCINRLPYNLYCVGGDVKHCTIQSNPKSQVVTGNITLVDVTYHYFCQRFRCRCLYLQYVLQSYDMLPYCHYCNYTNLPVVSMLCAKVSHECHAYVTSGMNCCMLCVLINVYTLTVCWAIFVDKLVFSRRFLKNDWIYCEQYALA